MHTNKLMHAFVLLLLSTCWSLQVALAQTVNLPSACGRDQLATLSDPTGTFGIRLSQYPNNLACRWRISTPDLSKRIKLSFSHLHTECSYDFVSVYDGPEANSGSIVGKLCGNRTSYVKLDVFVSTGPNLVVEFTTDIDVQGTGFTASYEVVDSCDNGLCFGRGTCVNGQCVCAAGAGGSMCERDSAGSRFTPRFSHAGVYLNGSDTMLVTGGQSLTSVLPFDNLQYSFSSQQWDDVNPPVSSNSPIPSPRYSHTMVTLGSRVFMFGGITLFGISSELWEYFPGTRQWSQLRPGIVLPGLYWPTFIAAPEENKLFLMGGWTQRNGYFSASRLAFAYDLAANTWKQLNSSSHPLQTFASSVASPGVYRPESRFIHVFTQTSIHSYHVPTDLWYFDLYGSGLNLESRMYRTGNLMGTSKSHVALFGGQLSALTAGSLSDMCFSDRLHVFDLDCMRVVNATSIPGKNRRSHSAVVRGANADELVILGGHNGADLGDLVKLQVPIPVLNADEKATCRHANWCAKFNDCADCVAKPGCGWCDGTCKYQCDNAICPARTIIPLGSTITSKLTAGSSVDLKVFINEPEKDIFFELYAPDRVKIPAIRMSIINLPKNGTFTTTEASSYMSSTDDRRFGGWYVIRLANTDTARDYTYTFLVSVQTSTVRTPTSNDDFNGQLMLGVGVICLLASGMIAFRQAVRRQRQIMMGVNPNSPMAIPKVGATMYQIHVNSLLPTAHSQHATPPQAPVRQSSYRGLFNSTMLPLLNTTIKSSAALPPSSPSLEKPTDPGSPVSGSQMPSSALSHGASIGATGLGHYASNDPILIPMSPMTPKTTIGRSNGLTVSSLPPQHITPLSVEVHTLPAPDPSATTPIAFVTYLVTMPGTPRDLVSNIPIMCAATAVVPMSPEAMADLPSAGNATVSHSRTSKSRHAARRRLQVLMERLRVNRGPNGDGGTATRGAVAALGSPMAPIGLTQMNGRL
ncbi:hypothetical protein BCR44DRAFT_84237 [Catenaria anguillulae PL171]|uniref:CUB domain-containing protein n=1 Tax=Catenaria anguillulae PL171 TaxID=765915 RepID=A0A1Y2HQV1_9FUNG|nr:hypothetical protein BCR44DRAFT_84237 [Catenaria anguillulae PL171]